MMKKAMLLTLVVFMLGCQTPQGNLGLDDGIDTSETILVPEGPTSPSGKLIFIEIDVGDQFVSEYDVESQEVTRLFSAPENGWVSQIDILSDSAQLLMAYASPPPEGQIQFGYTDIYLTAPDPTAVPALYIDKEHPEGLVFNPVWSPQNEYIYYSRVIPNSEDSTQFEIFLERFEVETGQMVQIVPDGIWPAVSPDFEQISYVTVDPQSLGNSLWIANPDGTEAQMLVPEEAFEVVDVPLFSPDGRWLYFTAAENRETAVHWWHRLFGIQTASAHNIPSDWYRIPTSGGDFERLTTIDETGIFGDFSPDGQYIAFATFNGLYLMNPDGSGLEKILDVGASTSLSWIR